jgi:hypothetical protein
LVNKMLFNILDNNLCIVIGQKIVAWFSWRQRFHIHPVSLFSISTFFARD